MPDEPINGGITLAVLGTKLDTLSEQIEPLCAEYHVDHDQIVVNTSHIASLETAITRPPMQCPRHDTLADQVTSLRLDMARISVTGGFTGGSLVAAVAGIVYGIGKAADWWQRRAMSLVDFLKWVFAGPGSAWLAYASIEFIRPRWPWLDNLDAELNCWFAAVISASLAISTWAIFSVGTHTFPEGDWFVWAERVFYVGTTAFGLAMLIQGGDIRGTERVNAGRLAPAGLVAPVVK